MKKLILLACTFCSILLASAQCEPGDYDFQGAEYGVFPDVASGLASGCLNEPYLQTIYFLVPSDAGAIDSLYEGVPISSITLNGISYNGGTDISTLGLTLSCNPANCTFMAGGQYCGRFPVPLPYSFPGYTFTVIDCANPNNVNEVVGSFELGAISPNPANHSARVPFTLSSNEKVDFTMVNMVGERIMSKTFAGKRGENTLTIDVAELPAGIYLYTVQSGSFKSTRKMVVQH